MERCQLWVRNVETGAPVTATVSVFDHGTDNLSTIYGDNDEPPTLKVNPFTVNGPEDAGTGYAFFYAANGRYDVLVTPAEQADGTTPAAYTEGDHLLDDPDDV